MAEELQESLSMTKFKFLANMKKFLANLLTDPVNSEPEYIFTYNGLNKFDLINHLLDNNIILRKNTIDDHDADGNPHTAKMVVKYTVPKNRLNDKLDCLYDILFPSIINEDGCAGAMGGGMGGAASANISAGGQYSQPIFGVQRRSPKKNKTDESKIYEAVTGEDVEKSAATYVYCNDKKGKLHILCAKRIKFPDDEMGGKWNPPMGHLHKGESMIDGAIRECFEESGVKLEKKYLKLISKEDYGNVYKVMLPGTIEDYPPKKGDEENGKFKWLPIEEIGNLEWAWTCGKIAKKLAKSETLNETTEERMSLLLLEALTPDEIYNKYYSTIDKNIFDSAIAADPTSYNQQGEIVKVGGYVKWILKLYQNGSWKTSDSFETKDLLGKFNKLKTRLPVEQRDINTYSSVRELYDILQPYLGTKSRSEIKQDAETVYEDEQWLIVIPHTEEAACYYGAHTKWCTAAKENNMFDYYNNEGPLYINIHKPTNRKYQFHFESYSFMDENDEKIKPKKLPWTEGALNYYKSINKYIYFIFDWIGDIDDDGIVPVELNRKQTWFSLEKQDYLFPNKWFGWAGGFDDNGIALVELNGKWTWFSLEKKDYLFPNLWFNLVNNFDNNGIAIVRLNDKYTWFSLEKQDYLFPNKWFDWVTYFGNNGIARVRLNDKDYFVTLDGQLLDYDTKQPLSDEELQSLQQQQQIAEMVNRLVRNYLR